MESNLTFQHLQPEHETLIYPLVLEVEKKRRARVRVVESFGWADHVRAWERLYQTGTPAG